VDLCREKRCGGQVLKNKKVINKDLTPCGCAVDKEYFVADLMTGISIHVDRFKLTYSHVYKTKEFETQQEEQTFGSISISYIF
jgi:hypothetical protein